MVSPYFFPEKKLTTFLVIALCKAAVTFFSFLILTTPNFWRRLSSVLSQFATKINSSQVHVTPLEGVTRGGPPLPSDATGQFQYMGNDRSFDVSDVANALDKLRVDKATGPDGLLP